MSEALCSVFFLLLSRDCIFNYLIDRKTLVNTLFCVETHREVFICEKNRGTCKV